MCSPRNWRAKCNEVPCGARVVILCPSLTSLPKNTSSRNVINTKIDVACPLQRRNRTSEQLRSHGFEARATDHRGSTELEPRPICCLCEVEPGAQAWAVGRVLYLNKNLCKIAMLQHNNRFAHGHGDRYWPFEDAIGACYPDLRLLSQTSAAARR